MTHPEAGKAWEFLRNATDDEIPLLWASLVVAQDEYPSLDVTAYEAQLAAYGTRVREAADDHDEDMVGAVWALNKVLFDELGFTGNQQDYYDPRNSYLNDVVERKLGIPISLAVIQLDLARRVGLPMHGVSFPGHFLVGMPMDGGLLVLDPYHRGRSVDAAELKQRLIDGERASAVLELDLSQVGEIDTAGLQLLALSKREALKPGHAVNVTIVLFG